ncbi:MAG: hypothetical protein ACFFKA_18870 [Candidatus Thorarchaeota archaeon]
MNKLKRRYRTGASVCAFLFYNKGASPLVSYWTFLNPDNFRDKLKYYFKQPDSKNRIPHTVICYVDDKFECILTKEKNQLR